MLPKDSEDRWALFSLSRWVIWLGIIPVSYQWGWLASVTFVAVCSLYANVASDFASWRADRNKEMKKKLQDIANRLDRIERLLEKRSGS